MSTRKTDYPTGSESGMSFICNRWVFTGPQGYRVAFDGTGHKLGEWVVRRYDASSTSFVYGGRHTTEDAAHEYAALLARTTPHPKPTEV